MDAYLEQYISGGFHGGVIEELYNYSPLREKIKTTKVAERSVLNVFRGWGRTKPVLKAFDESVTEAIRLSGSGAMKGLGRRTDFYTNLFHSFIQPKPEPANSDKKTYNYWRGMKSS